jgi:hypothetical protein
MWIESLPEGAGVGGVVLASASRRQFRRCIGESRLVGARELDSWGVQKIFMVFHNRKATGQCTGHRRITWYLRVLTPDVISARAPGIRRCKREIE